MKKTRIPITSFEFGEISPSLFSRTDTKVYNKSAQAIQNFNIRPEGGLVKRAGLQRIYDYGITQDTTKTFQSKLVPFIFSDDERYIVSIENAQVRVFLIDPITFELSLVSTITQDTDTNALPFDDDYIQEYTTAQSGDFMFICHGLFAPMLLVRTSLSTFEMQVFTFDESSDGNLIYQPYFNFHANNVTLSSSATTGSGVTLTTSASYFDTTGSLTGLDYLDSLHVGVVLRYGDTAEITITSVQSDTSATGDVLGTLRHRLINDALRTTDSSTEVEVTHVNHGFAGGETITIEDASAVGGIVGSKINGSRTVGAIIDENKYEITAFGAASSSEDGGGVVKIVSGGAITNWAEQCYSALRGYPFAVTFHEGRLCFGGSIYQPDAVWLSKTQSFFNFDTREAYDDDAIQLIASTGDVNQIRYLVSNRDLQVFTASSELYIPSFLNQPITPSNIQIKKQTPYGSAYVTPTPYDGATFFVQGGGNVLREYLYTDNENAYSAGSVSVMAAHIASGLKDQTVVNGAWAGSDSYAVYVNEDNNLGVFNSNRTEGRAGWSRYVTNGSFHSVVAIDDRLFANVWFDSGSTGTPDLDLMLCEFNESFNLDCSKKYTPAAGVVTVSSEFSNDVVVKAVVDGVYAGEFTVSAGTIDTGIAGGAEAEVGFSFAPILTVNPVDLESGNGMATGFQRGITAVVLDLVDTLSVKVETTPVEYTTSYTGKKEVYVHGYDRDASVTITQTKPLSLQINGLIAELVL